MGCKVLWLSVALIPYLMICEHVRAQCTQPSFESRNVILSESYHSGQSFPDGSTVTFDCEVGHRPVNSRASKSVTCERNQWTSLELECTKKKCGSLPDFHNGYYERTGNLFGDNVKAVCNKGYTLDGKAEYRWCRDKGWDGRDPVCEVVKCEAPPAILNGQLLEEPLDSYDYLQVVSYRCNNGFSLFGNSMLHCSEDGIFKPDPPKCMDGCPKPEISNATRTAGSSPPYKQGNFIDYKCNDGFTMKGKSYIVCGSTGWNPEPPKCIEHCSLPVFGENITLTEEFRGKNKFPYESKVTFECIRGYAPVNSTVSNSITCEENKWTKLIFSCKALPSTTTTARIVTSMAQPKDNDSTAHFKVNTFSATTISCISVTVTVLLLVGVVGLTYFLCKKKPTFAEELNKSKRKEVPTDDTYIMD